MYLPVENIKDFMEILEAVADDDKDGTPVFIRKNKVIDENSFLIGEVVLQCQYDTGMMVMYRHREEIEPVPIPNVEFFSALSVFGDEEITTKIHTSIETKKETLDKQLNSEFEKVSQVLAGKGFKTLIPAVWL